MAISPVDIAYYISLGRGMAKGGKEGTGYLLSDPEYLEAKGTLKKASREAEKVERASGATERGAKKSQRSFLTAQGFGQGFQERAERELDPVLQSYGLRNTAAGREMFESAVQRELAARDQTRKEVSTGLSTGAALEGTIGSAILAATPAAAFAPIHAALSSAKGAFYGASTSAIPSIRKQEQEKAGDLRDRKSTR